MKICEKEAKKHLLHIIIINPLMWGNARSSLTNYHISYTCLLARHPWITSREWFQSFECKRTCAQGLAWHDQT